MSTATATAKPAQRLSASIDDNRTPSSRLPYGDARRSLGLHGHGTVVWRDEAWYCDEMEVFTLYDVDSEPIIADVEFLRSELERIAAENDAAQETVQA